MSEALYCILESLNAKTARIGDKEALMKEADTIVGAQVCRIVPFYGKD